MSDDKTTFERNQTANDIRAALKKANDQAEHFEREWYLRGDELDTLRERVKELDARLNTPELADFTKAVALEGAHQIERWGTGHDAGKTPQDWFWLVGYLAGKALRSHIDGDTAKASHHTITIAAACANWHRAINGANDMRPGLGHNPTVSPARGS